MPFGEPSFILHTLGPEGTNCAEAARRWLSEVVAGDNPADGDIVLHRTLEDAADAMTDPEFERLISCAAYPDLHTFIFSRLDRLVMTDAFVMPTHSMVFASRSYNGEAPRSTDLVASHPAPQHLVTQSLETPVLKTPGPYSLKLDGAQSGNDSAIIWATSNADAAVRCAQGETNACITTEAAAQLHGLTIERDFGPVPMAFLVHALRS